jgi:hypothetical protein
MMGYDGNIQPKNSLRLRDSTRNNEFWISLRFLFFETMCMANP